MNLGKLLIISEEEIKLTESFISTQGSALKSMYWDVSYLLGTNDSALFKKENHVRLSRRPLPIGIVNRVVKFIRSLLLKDVNQALPEELKRWKNKIVENSPDLILVQFASTAIRILPVLEDLKIPWVVQCHGYDVTQRCSNLGYRLALRQVFRKSNLIFGCSNFLCSVIKKYCASKDYHKIRVISPGFDESIFQNSNLEKNREFTFISVARLTDVKGHDLTIEAFSKADLKAKLLIVGEGEEHESLQALIKDLKQEDRIFLLGSKNLDEVFQIIQESQVFIQSSRRSKSGAIEGLGLSSLESQALGLPVIVSNSGGLGETCINGQTGLIYQEGDVDELVLCMKKMFENIQMRTSMSKKARTWSFENFSSASQARKAGKYFSDLLGGSNEE